MYEKLGTFHVPLPQDEDDNYIADQWQREQHLSSCDGLEDEDYKPEGATKGDGLSLYEEYRGFMIMSKHERLNPRKKDLFIYDPDQLVENSFFEKAVDPIKVWYVRKEQIHAFDSNNSRVVLFIISISFLSKTSNLFSFMVVSIFQIYNKYCNLIIIKDLSLFILNFNSLFIK